MGQDLESKANPGARWGHTLIYYPEKNNLLLFGGTNKRGGDYLDDTWIWENDEWKKLDVKGPPARSFCAATFHKTRNSILLHGGRGNNRITNADLWEWDGTSWRQPDIDSAYKADHHQMVYLEGQDALLAYGGWNGEDVSGDTWMWSGNWKQFESTSPPKRAAFSMVYNEKQDQVVLYGGLWINGQYADIWQWSKNEWMPSSVPYANSSLDHHSMIYDGGLEQIIGFGGKNYRYTFQNRTFRVEDDKIQAIDIEGPSARHSFGFTFDTNQKVGYLFGGKEYVDGQQLPLDDFWKWDGQKWSLIQKGSTEK